MVVEEAIISTQNLLINSLLLWWCEQLVLWLHLKTLHHIGLANIVIKSLLLRMKMILLSAKYAMVSKLFCSSLICSKKTESYQPKPCISFSFKLAMQPQE
jgi:hypothetical protein